MQNGEHKALIAGRATIKSLCNLTPVTAVIASFYEEYANQSWQDRREMWENEFAERLKDLEDEMELEKIKSIPNFASILASAQKGAMNDIDGDKVGLYANYVINAIKQENPDNTKLHLFLNILSKYSLAHIETLRYFSNPEKYWLFEKKHNIHAALFYQFRKKEYFDSATHSYQKHEIEHLVIKDFLSDYLIETPDISYTILMASSRMQAPITTPIANEFLKFIAENDN